MAGQVGESAPPRRASNPYRGPGKTTVKSLLALLCATALLGVAVPRAEAAEAVHETRAASGFSRIEIDGQAEVILRQGSVEGVAIDASPQALRNIETSVRGRTLVIEITEERRWWDWMLGGGSTRTPRIVINFIQLDRIEAAGSVTVTAASLKSEDLRVDFAGACTLVIGDLQASRLRLEGAGAVKAELSGKVTSQFVDLSGASSYMAGALVSDSASLQVSGAGKALVNAGKILKVEIAGAGVVTYLGDPKIEQEISGLGRVSRAEPR
ncbi:MAG: head GIN domain-containing protein [Betaproteobacteria bacterium]